MREGVPGICLFQASLDLGEEVHTLHCVLDRRVRWERLNRLNHTLFHGLLRHEASELEWGPAKRVRSGRNSFKSLSQTAQRTANPRVRVARGVRKHDP